MFLKIDVYNGAMVDDLDFGFRMRSAPRNTAWTDSRPRNYAFAFELREAGILTEEDFCRMPG